ncbi:antitermination regulator [Cryobacterium sp. MLB-32]|uniref:GAF and ANTAR domain-containing protein n=1 Tax=Cryobacterium sp. MLB-32 TaxID=1529318 RepID=UPI0004E6D995|nr:GAF and ANTAR domain-containing protein [Cryobacterium sp. MLB-32]KFF60813.1 antitermination regulator [Cryobacterium sp. MLB-32]
MSHWGFSNEGDSETAACAQFLAALPVAGVAVAVFGASLPETAVCSTDALATRLDELQFDLGEGPRWEAVQSRLPVLLPHVQDRPHPDWPMFGNALLKTDVQALFVFPLVVGALDVGVVELYSHSPDTLGPEERIIALALADRLAWSLLNRILAMNDQTHGDEQDSPLSRREIHQATGMVLVQLGLTATEALMRLRAHAFSHDESVRDVARQVVRRTLVFSD